MINASMELRKGATFGSVEPCHLPPRSSHFCHVLSTQLIAPIVPVLAKRLGKGAKHRRCEREPSQHDSTVRDVKVDRIMVDCLNWLGRLTISHSLPKATLSRPHS